MKVFNERSPNRKAEHNNDTFVTPDNALKPFVKFMVDNGILYDNISIYDPSSGHGDNKNKIYNYIKANTGIKVASYKGNDMNDGGIEYTKYNNEYNGHADLLITNPPYNQKDVFLELCLEHRGYFGSSVALLLPVATFSGLSRYKMFENYGYPALVGYNRRPQFVKGGSSNLDVAWFVWSDIKLENIMLNLEK